MSTDQNSRRSEMRLYDNDNNRLYINSAERVRFLNAVKRFPVMQQAFCLTLLYTGCRISEALAMTTPALQRERRLISLRTLKRRKFTTREVPVPLALLNAIDAYRATLGEQSSTEALWRTRGKVLGRIAAYRVVKEVMTAAEITGAQACPKGLRHGYGIHATLSGVQLHMLSIWMGHASIATTQIYATACGIEEQQIAARMWGRRERAMEVVCF